MQCMHMVYIMSYSVSMVMYAFGYEAIMHCTVSMTCLPPGTAAVKVFVKYFPRLQQVVNPSDITESLFANGLLTDDEKESADHMMYTSGVRMKLLGVVMKAIQIDSKNLNIFLDILGTIAKYKPLVDEMRRDLQVIRGVRSGAVSEVVMVYGERTYNVRCINMMVGCEMMSTYSEEVWSFGLVIMWWV